MVERDLDNLIASWVEGRIDECESQTLQCLLLESPAARMRLREYASLDAGLREIAEAVELSNSTGLARAIAAGTRATVGNGPHISRIQASGHAREHTQLRAWMGWLVTAAAGVLLAAYLVNRSETTQAIADSQSEPNPLADSARWSAGDAFPKPPAPVATLTLADAARWDHGDLSVGEALLEGDTISLTDGKAQIGVGCGAEIIADGPASLTFLTYDRVRLNHGRVVVDVAPWAQGFTVETNSMDVVDLGTTFTVSASSTGQADAAVLKGMVRVHASGTEGGQQRGMLITEGEQASSDGNVITRGIHDPGLAQLLHDLNFDATGRYRPVDLFNTGFGLSIGDEDRHWKVAGATPDGDKRWRYASVCVPHESYLPNEPNTSQWVSIEGWETADANATYTFQNTFDLRGYDLDTMQLFGRFLADNGVSAVRVNGKSVPVQSWVDNVKYQPFGIPQFRFVNVTQGLVEGMNVVEVDVRNGMQRTWTGDGSKVELKAIPNPMALRVEWYAFGRSSNLAQRDDARDRAVKSLRFPSLGGQQRGPGKAI